MWQSTISDNSKTSIIPESLVQQALDALMQGRTSVIIAHRLSTVRRADCIYVLKEGEVVESGTHDELVARPNGVYRTLSELQFDLGEPERAPQRDGDNGSTCQAGKSARQAIQ